MYEVSSIFHSSLSKPLLKIQKPIYSNPKLIKSIIDSYLLCNVVHDAEANSCEFFCNAFMNSQ